MSYDILVFEPTAAPQTDRSAFILWYEEQTKWSEPHGYDDPSVTTPSLRAWLIDLCNDYPSLKSAAAKAHVDNPRLTDYTIGMTLIYAAFARSQMNAAIQRTFVAAQRHKLGFFNASAPGQDVWLPNPKTGRLKTAFR